MKYLYAILRLFKCPHKYAKVESFIPVEVLTGNLRGRVYVCKCSRCGKHKRYNL